MLAPGAAVEIVAVAMGLFPGWRASLAPKTTIAPTSALARANFRFLFPGSRVGPPPTGGPLDNCGPSRLGTIASSFSILLMAAPRLRGREPCGRARGYEMEARGLAARTPRR